MRRTEWLGPLTICVYLTLMILPTRISAEPAPVMAALALAADASKQSALTGTAPASTPPPFAGDYRVGPGDLLRVNVFDHPELAADLRVSQSGNLTFPLLGQLAVAGKSPHDIESALVQGLSNGGFVREPQVSVLVIDYQSQKISVMGQVTRPGQYVLTASEHALDLLAEAGGVVNMIAADEATLIRRGGERLSIDLIAMFAGDPRQNPEVGAGDTIYVPRAPQFYVYGEVQRPGVYRLERRMTVSQAISAGGGLTPKGSERRAIVKRRDSSGKERKVSVSASDMLEPDDVLMIKQGLF
jgi:polysaccharide export outer membrane protein